MTESNCHILHMDPTKRTIIVGYVGEAQDTLSHDVLENLLRNVVGNSMPQFVNIVMLNAFGLRIAEQEAIIDFINTDNNHSHVKRFIDHFNATEADIMRLFANSEPDEIHQHTYETPQRLLNELLVDAMIASAHA